MFTSHTWEFRDFPLLFKASAAASMGISRHNLFYSGRYPVVVAGVRMDQKMTVSYPAPIWADDDWTETAQNIRALRLKFPHIAAAGVSAAILYGWPLPAGTPHSPLHIASDNANLRVRMPAVVLHRSRPFAVRNFFGLPVLGPAEAFILLGRTLTLHDLVRVGDAAVGNWHGPPLLGLEELSSAVDSIRGIRALPHLRAALDLIRPTVDSPRETDLRLWTRAVGLPEPTVHPQIFCRALNRVVEPDLGYEQERLALEYEGDHHRTSKSQWSRDIERDEAMRAEGWVTFRVTSRTDYALLEGKIRRHLGLQPRPRA
ncbi:hypothetical protein [Brevibacterium sp. 2SA]|uniref:hypothetical protein n=1 Tax=Brevibacterium sp. 2SA TaxID=2502198 RepID=UPI002016F6EF|nr:hypothetical protein [Brevibacterium sp. 2SA]